MDNLVIVCADVGSIPKNNFGWWASKEHFGKDLSGLADFVARALNAGLKVALGFECPLFVLVPDDEQTLTRARPGEGNRAWCAGAGSGAVATGLVQVTWALRAIRDALHQATPVHLDWRSFAQAQHGLFLWEAFVSGPGKAPAVDTDLHVADACAGARAFRDAMPELESANAISPGDHEVYSMLGGALLRTGWSTDLSLLARPCLVIRTAVPVDAGVRV